MIISIWVIISFLLLPAGSLRYWTVAFVALLLVVGVGDDLPVRALLVTMLALHVAFVVPAAARSGQPRFLWMALVSLVLLTGLVVTGGVHYWLPALIVAVLVVPFGVPLLWRRPPPSGPAFEVRLWPRRRGDGPPISAQSADGPAGVPTAEAPADLPPANGDGRGSQSEQGAGDDQQPGSPPPRNVRAFPLGKRPAGRPTRSPWPQRQRRPPAAS
ncbi:hypothetical protein [Paractinoplanes globisporus]|uniref:Uncharacterized protein n=1 Tax=Paractinoplanes globisporus TaxID=113565 RepID=A0ABW6W3A7_9ACTN|nr:hypothetical protein [Actinoplanes globisporus]